MGIVLSISEGVWLPQLMSSWCFNMYKDAVLVQKSGCGVGPLTLWCRCWYSWTYTVHSIVVPCHCLGEPPQNIATVFWEVNYATPVSICVSLCTSYCTPFKELNQSISQSINWFCPLSVTTKITRFWDQLVEISKKLVTIYFNCVGRGAELANLISDWWGGRAKEAIYVHVVEGGSDQDEPGIATGSSPEEDQ